MQVPLNWLKDYVDITLPLDELVERLTLAGLEVGAVDKIGDWWDRERIVVGEVRAVRPHPDADRLVLVDVAYGGGEIEQCVTGAPNLFPFKGAGPVSLKVAFAMEGAELYDGHQEGFVKTRLKRTKIRGVPSRAMVCSEKELGLSEAHEGILFLPADAPVGAPLADYMGDTVLDLELTPNLARVYNMLGVAREVAALTGQQVRYPDTGWTAQGAPAGEMVNVVIQDPDLCSRFTASLIRDVEIGPAPQWMQDRVRRAGMRPISNIVDITNYVMLEYGQPLHAFDYDKLVARAGGAKPTIIVRRAQPGETMTTLDGVSRTFGADTLLITDTGGPIGIAGVMGGLDTEIDGHTRHILLEAANFNFINIRRTAQELRLPSEAAARFGRGIHPSLAELGSRRASELMRQLAGGTISRDLVDVYPVQPQPVVVELTAHEVERCLGIRFDMDEVTAMLERLEFQVERAGQDTIRATVPNHRLDVEYPADLIEEVARLYGYDRIPITELADRLPPQRANRPLQLEEAARDILVASGLQEVITYSLTSLEREASLVPGTQAGDLDPSAYVVLANPITQERSVMRHHLLTGLLETAAANLRYRDRVELFEVGKVFPRQPGQELPDEPLRLGLLVTGPRVERHWLTGSGDEGDGLDFFDLKGIVETLLARLHVAGAVYEPAEHPSFQPGRTARLSIDGHDVGILGEVSAAVRAAYDLPGGRVAAAELDLDALLAQVPAAWFVEPISPYPAVLQDLAVIVDEAVPAATAGRLIREAGGALLKNVELFDVYRGEPVPAGRKSLAFSLTFQAPDKTLSDKIVAGQVKRIVGRLETDLGAVLR